MHGCIILFSLNSLKEEITGLKRQIHSRDTEFSEREIKLTVTIKKHEGIIEYL